jgi:hypothetical protein
MNRGNSEKINTGFPALLTDTVAPKRRFLYRASRALCLPLREIVI